MLLSLTLLFTTANGQISLVVNPVGSDGAVESYKLSDINKLSFSGDSFTVDLTNESTTATFALKNVMSIKFEDVNSGVTSAIADDGALQLYYDKDMLGAYGELNEHCVATVFDVAGRVLLQIDAWDGCPIDVSSLSKGLYLFNVSNQTLKFKK